ncbi:hypothetical protein CIHG_07720 [Coccidioides immitis H538.4]|uniref:Uncharacterized protein n=3 Tax=Coccidioides immitis TaxID=5501 RepID=A0A0J8QTB1_COCIT|nr:hypothetical protein CIRG_04193 [Coccidioides immitis RMSCC 2394]KMU76089.1 hypothetical protein CISG_05347 [Coccidioides immitis RMSCC 3703]KMU90036.1 hypothetical protein CIHG_07720 [Coccidioides immitis H538.4]
MDNSGKVEMNLGSWRRELGRWTWRTMIFLHHECRFKELRAERKKVHVKKDAGYGVLPINDAPCGDGCGPVVHCEARCRTLANPAYPTLRTSHQRVKHRYQMRREKDPKYINTANCEQDTVVLTCFTTRFMTRSTNTIA